MATVERDVRPHFLGEIVVRASAPSPHGSRLLRPEQASDRKGPPPPCPPAASSSWVDMRHEYRVAWVGCQHEEPRRDGHRMHERLSWPGRQTDRLLAHRHPGRERPCLPGVTEADRSSRNALSPLRLDRRAACLGTRHGDRLCVRQLSALLDGRRSQTQAQRACITFSSACAPVRNQQIAAMASALGPYRTRFLTICGTHDISRLPLTEDSADPYCVLCCSLFSPSGALLNPQSPATTEETPPSEPST
jgi:hypothetical protein